MSKGLSVTAIEKLKPREQRYEVSDAGKPGLYLVVHPTGRKSWAVRYRHRGVSRKLTLAGFPSLTTARKLAQDALDACAGGRDPAQEKQAAKNTPGSLVQDVFAEFMARHVRKRSGVPIRESTRRETGRLLGLQPKDGDLSTWEPRTPKSGVVTRWHGRDIASITKRDVLNLLDDVAKEAPVGANRCLAALKTAFRWCVKRDILAASPCEHVDDPSPEESAERPLSDPEVAAIWRAAEGMSDTYGRLVQFLLLTGQRRDEVRQATWSEFDLKNRSWKLPGRRTKNGREHHVPMSDAAMAVLDNVPKVKGKAGWIFSLDGKVPVSNLARCKKRLDAAMIAELRKVDADAPVPERWRLHDLRHTLKTWMQRTRVPKDVRNAVQNHYDGDMDELYGHYTFEGEKREALDGWSRYVESLVTGKPSNVVPLPARA